MKAKFTHAAEVRGCDARTSKNFRRVIRLRETKLYFISPHGRIFRKRDGIEVGDWPLLYIDLTTLREIES